MKDYFIPFNESAQDSFVEKNSKFIGSLWHVESVEQATQKLKQMREKYWDASHNCWAYILKDGAMRYSDDGEPQGTAGMPILDVLRHENLVDVCCVVTRYFGGTLLGTGGLVRAYTKGAKIAVEAAGIKQMSVFSTLLINSSYALFDNVQRILKEKDCVIENIEYGENVVITCFLKEGMEIELNKLLSEATCGKINAKIIQTSFMGTRFK